MDKHIFSKVLVVFNICALLNLISFFFWQNLVPFSIRRMRKNCLGKLLHEIIELNSNYFLIIFRKLLDLIVFINLLCKTKQWLVRFFFISYFKTAICVMKFTSWSVHTFRKQISWIFKITRYAMFECSNTIQNFSTSNCF